MHLDPEIGSFHRQIPGVFPASIQIELYDFGWIQVRDPGAILANRNIQGHAQVAPGGDVFVAWIAVAVAVFGLLKHLDVEIIPIQGIESFIGPIARLWTLPN